MGVIVEAIKLVKAAKILGADFVKFQIFKTENLVLKNTKKQIIKLKMINHQINIKCLKNLNYQILILIK